MRTKPSADSVGLEWFKSTYSTNEDPACVEVAVSAQSVHVRDSKDPDGPHLTFSPTQWTAFLAYAADHV